MGNVESEGKQEEDQEENKGDGSNYVTDRDKPFDTGIFR